MTQVLKKYGDGIIGVALLVVLATYMIVTPRSAEAASGGYEWKSFEVTCPYTGSPVRIDKDIWVGGGSTASLACWPSRESPNDSTDCFMVGGSDVDDGDSTTSYPVGGCAIAQYPSISVNGGNLYCYAEDGLADVVIKCLASR